MVLNYKRGLDFLYFKGGRYELPLHHSSRIQVVFGRWGKSKRNGLSWDIASNSLCPVDDGFLSFVVCLSINKLALPITFSNWKGGEL